MRLPPAEMDCAARSPPCRPPAWPEFAGERVGVCRQRDQAQVVAAVQRQFRNPLVLDHGAEGDVLRLQHLSRGRNLNRLGDLPDLQREIEADGLLNLHWHVAAARFLERGLFHPDVVNAGRDSGKRVVAGTGRNPFPYRIRRHVGEGYFRGRYGGPARIADVARDLTERLSE